MVESRRDDLHKRRINLHKLGEYSSHRCRPARHDQLTNAALAAWFGALRSRDLETKSL
jgi:hypothetical protein